MALLLAEKGLAEDLGDIAAAANRGTEFVTWIEERCRRAQHRT